MKSHTSQLSTEEIKCEEFHSQPPFLSEEGEDREEGEGEEEGRGRTFFSLSHIKLVFFFFFL